jgi:branched-chain amino acid transport system ATP-binding protein
MISLSIHGLRKSFGNLEIIRGVDLEVFEQETHAIIGPNGAGKSTLFHLISGRLYPTAGEVRLFGRDIAGSPPHVVVRQGLSRSFQISSIFPRLSVYENLRCAVFWSIGERYCFWRSVDSRAEVKHRTEQLLQLAGLEPQALRPAGTLSYANQRSLELGIAIASDPKVLLLDEPTAGMSQAETEQAIDLIRVVGKNRTIVIVEHDMQVVFNLADRVSVMVQGAILATDTPARLRENEDVQRAYLDPLSSGQADV